MISLEDCIALCGLSQEEVAAIAEHEHLPQIAAAVQAQYMLAHAKGPEKIREMLVDDIRAALAIGNQRHAAELVSALHQFLNARPCGKADFSVKEQT